MPSIFSVQLDNYLPMLPSLPSLQYFRPSSPSPLEMLKSTMKLPGKVKALLYIIVGYSSMVTIHGFLCQLCMSGNSKQPFIRYLHGFLKNYFNCGFFIRREFNVRLPWQYLVIPNGNFVIVNYGSYGTVPRDVLHYQKNVQFEVELCPDNFYRKILLTKYKESRDTVSKFVGCQPENCVFVDNITDGINCTLRSILKDLDDDDIVMYSNFTYSAVVKAIAIISKQFDVKTAQLDIILPIESEDQLCEAYEEFIESNPKVKIAIFDHISSASAVQFPIVKLAKICRDHNIMSIVDGAHAPGQLHLNIESYGVDIYIGNLHKWYYTPKSCAIMYINPKHHDRMHPSLVSHHAYKSNLQERFWRQGTKNYSSHITAGYAVGHFMECLGGIDHLHSYITPLVEWAVELYKREWNTEEIMIPTSMKAPYMRVVYLPTIFTTIYGPRSEDADRMILDLLNDHNIVMFVNPVDGRLATRVSAQIFSTKSEYIYVAQVVKRLALQLKNKFNLID